MSINKRIDTLTEEEAKFHLGQLVEILLSDNWDEEIAGEAKDYLHSQGIIEASNIFWGICDNCKEQKDVMDISDDPISTTTLDRQHIDICIICADCMKGFLNRMRRMIGEKEIA